MTKKELFLVITNTTKLEVSDAIILLEGDGFNRIPTVLSLVKDGWSDTLVFSGGVDNEAVGSYNFEKCMDKILVQEISIKKIFNECKSLNTREQAEECISLCEKYNWKKILLVASHYHQYRAFLTFLKVLEERKLEKKIHVINCTAILDWFETLDYGQNRIDLLKGEFDKIEIYKTKTHISSYESALDYYEFWGNR